MSAFTTINEPAGEPSNFLQPEPTTPTAVTHLRRPETSDENAFWHITEESWSELVARCSDASLKKNAMNTLRKFDAAGRIMETDEGELASQPCSWCTRGGLEVDCRVYKNNKEKACAYCRRHGKAGCSAGDPSRAAPPSVEERLRALEETVTRLSAENESLRASQAAALASAAAMQQRIDELETWETQARGSIAMLELADYQASRHARR